MLSLSEMSRVDTCRTLRDLYRRLAHKLLPTLNPAVVQRKEDGSAVSKERKPVAKGQRKKIREPTLARVYVQDSSKPGQIAIVRPRTKNASGSKKKSSEVSKVDMPGSKQSSSVSKARPTASTVAVEKIEANTRSKEPRSPPPPPPPPYHQPQHTPPQPTPSSRHERIASTSTLTPRPQVHRIHSQPVQVSTDPPPPSALSVIAAQSSPHLMSWLESSQHLPRPPPPPSIIAPVEHRPLPTTVQRRQPIPTYHSAQTASTQLGEVPLHKWAEVYDFDAAKQGNRKAMEQGWPVWGEMAVVQEESDGRKGERRGGFRAWFRGRK